MHSLQSGHQVDLLVTGQEFFPSLIAAVDAAKKEVRLETYILHEDSVGEEVLAALERAAQRSVAVYLVVDGIGTPQLPLRWRLTLKQSGVQWQQFKPLGSLGLLIPGRWRRLHRKLCVVDRQIAFCGGINLLDDFFELNHGPQPTARYDFAVRVQGPLVADMHFSMEQFWKRLRATRQLKRGEIQDALLTMEDLVIKQRTHAEHGRDGEPPGMRAALLLRDNLRHRTGIERAYRHAIAHARHEVVIANAYFLPGAKLRRALILATQRGVRVRLLLQGRYEFFMQFHAAKPGYRELLEAGVEIHEYMDGFLHAKVAVIDGKWSTVGSSNLDPLSLLLAREANVVVEDAGFAQNLLQSLNQAIAERSRPLELNTFSHRPLWQRLQGRIAYSLMRLTLFLTGRDY